MEGKDGEPPTWFDDDVVGKGGAMVVDDDVGVDRDGGEEES